MGYADLIANKVAALPAARQAEILRYVEAVAGEPSGGRPAGPAGDILQRTWGAWGQGSKDEIDKAIAAMRDEWERSLSEPSFPCCAKSR